MLEPDESQWNGESATAYECARECLTHLMAIYSAEINDERNRSNPDQGRVMRLITARSNLARERERIHMTDKDAVESVRSKYGRLVRAYNAGTFRPEGEEEHS